MAGEDDVHRIADRLAPEVRRQFLEAVAALTKRVTVDAIAEAVERGGALAVRLEAALADFPEDLRGTAAVVRRVADESAEAAARELEERFTLRGRFDLVNPRAVEAAETLTADLVREIGEQTRRAIRSVVARSIREGIPPRVAAREIRTLVGLTERQAMAVINYRFSLLEGGASPTAVQKAAERYAARLLRQRALLIARTETIRAGRIGRHTAWREAREAGLIPPGARKRWVVTPDDKLCPICAPLGPPDPAEAELDQPFETALGSVDGPPLHPACRCTTVLVLPRRRRAA
ncbi:MAG: phage minor head protein [Vicinamibacterales bacterium]